MARQASGLRSTRSTLNCIVTAKLPSKLLHSSEEIGTGCVAAGFSNAPGLTRIVYLTILITHREPLPGMLRAFHFVQKRDRIIGDRVMAFAIRGDEQGVGAQAEFSGVRSSVEVGGG